MEDKKLEKMPVVLRAAAVVATAAFVTAGTAGTAFSATSTTSARGVTPQFCGSPVGTVSHTNGVVLTKITPTRTGLVPSDVNLICICANKSC